MPILDMNVDELKTYRGTNPRPADFDSYWDRALNEMKQVNSDPVLVPADFQAPGVECFHYYFTGVGDARIHAKYLRPSNAGVSAPAIIFFHGYSMDGGSWTSHLAWVLSGFHVWAMDCRGQGGLSEDTGVVKGNTQKGHIIRGLSDAPDRLYYRGVFLDCAQLAGLVMETKGVDKNRVGVRGGSQGGGLTLACSALEPRVAALAPVYPFLCDYKRVWDIDLAKRAYEELVFWFRRFDPRHEREDEVFTTLGYIDVQFLAGRIRGDVLMAVGLADDVCPPSSQFAVFNRISAQKTVHIYPDFGHEDLPGFDDLEFSFFRKMIG